VPELGDVREAIASLLKDAYGGSLQVSAWFLSSPTPPSIDIYPDEMEYHKAMQDGAADWELTVRAIVAGNSDIGAQQRLDPMLAMTGAGSLKEAIEGTTPGAQTLGGLVSDVTVTRTTGYRMYEISATQIDALGAQWTVAILV
jgi:hypothetical protein